MNAALLANAHSGRNCTMMHGVRLLASAGVRVREEVDDMAIRRLLAREGDYPALVPPVVVKDKIATGKLVVTHQLSGISGTFHPVTLSRRLPNPLVTELIESMKAKRPQLGKTRS